MASQITHIVYADKFIKANPGKWERSNFLVGTVFPDIRYLNVLSREQTHVKGLSLEDILSEASAFKAGMMFHAFLDDMCDRIIGGDELVRLHPEFLWHYLALKLLQDERVYKSVDDWRQVAGYFDRVLSDELAYGVSDEVICHWHSILRSYCLKGLASDQPMALAELGISKANIALVMAGLNESRNDLAAISLIRRFNNEAAALIGPKG